MTNSDVAYTACSYLALVSNSIKSLIQREANEGFGLKQTQKNNTDKQPKSQQGNFL